VAFFDFPDDNDITGTDSPCRYQQKNKQAELSICHIRISEHNKTPIQFNVLPTKSNKQINNATGIHRD
jgi:hypothetical protein